MLSKCKEFRLCKMVRLDSIAASVTALHLHSQITEPLLLRMQCMSGITLPPLWKQKIMRCKNCSGTEVNYVCASKNDHLKECYTLTWYQQVLVHQAFQLCLRIIQQSSQRMLYCYLSFANLTCFRKKCLCFLSLSPTSGFRTHLRGLQNASKKD